MMRVRVFLLAAFLCATPVLAENWPGFRGPKSNGYSAEEEIPLKWDKDTNVRWKVKLPLAGNSSPVVWGDRIFISQALDMAGHRRALLCLARADGKELWRKEVKYDDKEPTHKTNPFCPATPLTDGERVVVSHGSAGMYCYDMDGKELWKYDLGKLWHIWGTASSPIFYGDLCILWCGPGERQFLLAVNKQTGKKVWEHQEPGGKEGKGGSSNWLGSWSTPIVAHVNGRDELILGVPYKLKAFNPKSGQELWSCDGMGPLVYTSPSITKDGIVVAMSGFGGPAMAVKAGGQGNVTATHRLWHQKKGGGQRIGSPMIVGDHAFMITGNGLGQCFEIKTGKELWGNKPLGNREQAWGSFVLVGKRLYGVNNAGECFVLAASPKFELLATNRLNETVRGSFAISDGDLFIRGYQHLWCIRKK